MSDKSSTDQVGTDPGHDPLLRTSGLPGSLGSGGRVPDPKGVYT